MTAQAKGSLFISYRRDDAAGYAGRLYDRLAAQFGHDRVFMDVEGIDPGADFVDAIERAVGSCEILIVIIGDDWLAKGKDGKRRLDDPADFVRLETAAALKRGIRVVPVLVEGASMPRAEDLPADLAPLVRRQAVELNHRQWEATSGELIATLERLLDRGPATAGSSARHVEAPSAQPATVVEPRSSKRPIAVIAAGIAVAVIAAVVLVMRPWEDRSPEGKAAKAQVAKAPADVATKPQVAKAPTEAEPKPPQVAKAPTEAEPKPQVAKAPTEAEPKPQVAKAPTEAEPKPQVAKAPAEAEPKPPVAKAPAEAEPKPQVAKAPTEADTKPQVAKVPIPPDSKASPAKSPPAKPATSEAKPQIAKGPLQVEPAAKPEAFEPPAKGSPGADKVADAKPAASSIALPVRLPRVGDTWQYSWRSTLWRNVEPRSFAHQVTSVSEREIAETMSVVSATDKGALAKTFAADTRYVEWRGNGFYLVEFNPFLSAFDALAPDTAWKAMATPVADPFFSNWYTQGRSTGWDTVTVPAGTFKALRVEINSNRPATTSLAMRGNEPVRVLHVAWYAPEAKRMVKQVRTTFAATGGKLDEDAYELVRYSLR